MNGDNYISYEVDTYFEDLQKVGSDNNINIIVLKDQDKYGDSALYYVTEGSLTNLNWSTEVYMCNPFISDQT